MCAFNYTILNAHIHKGNSNTDIGNPSNAAKNAGWVSTSKYQSLCTDIIYLTEKEPCCCLVVSTVHLYAT